MRSGKTYRTVECLSEKHLDLDLIVVADDALTRTHQVSGRGRCLDFEHNGLVTLIDEPDIR